MSITEKVARFVAETQYEAIPPAALGVAKGAMMDCLGVTLAAIDEPVSKTIVEFVREVGGKGEATVIGAGLKAAPPDAALANGTLAHALDYDDVAMSMTGHPSVPLLPAVLALGEHIGAAGRNVLTAYVVGYEVQTKVGLATGPKPYNRGWHHTSTLGTLGAAAASANLLRLSPTECAMALGLAASQASGLRQNFGTFTKPFHAGHAAKSGVVAALLARKGFTADATILEGRFGFLNVFNEGAQWNPEPFSQLGNPFDLLATGVTAKQYPCCAFTHRQLDAALAVVTQWDISPQSVASLTCTIPQRDKEVLIHSRPTTGLEGKFSLEYCLSAALLDRRIGLQTFEDEQVRRPEIRALLEKVEVKVKGEGSERVEGISVTVTLKDGREFSHTVKAPKGSPEVSLSRAELEAKYTDCARRALSAEGVQHSLAMLGSLEELESIGELMKVVG